MNEGASMNPAKRGQGRNDERRKAKRKARREAEKNRKKWILYLRATGHYTKELSKFPPPDI